MLFSLFLKAVVRLRAGIAHMMKWISRIGLSKVVAAGVVLVAVGGVAANFLLSGTAAELAVAQTPLVKVQKISDLSAETVPLAVVGIVTSRSEATVRAQKSGEITAVYRSLGDSVGAGAIVAEFEDDSERAALLQAQGSVDAARANLEKVQKGTRTEQLAILQATLDGASSGAVNTLLSAYASVDNAVRGTTDLFFSNPSGSTPHFNVVTPNTQLQNDVQNQRGTLTLILTRQATRGINLSASDDLTTELTRTEGEVRAVRGFLDDIIAILNTGIPDGNYSATTIATYLASATASRTSINTTLAAISSARQTLQTAQKNAEQGISGAQPEDIASAEAALTQAQGALASARANLEKSILRAPISGTINSLSLKLGDYVTAGTPVVTIANNGALEVLVYLTENDAREVAVGQSVILEEGSTGVVTKLAPALDPLTKKMEVRIGINGKIGELVNGQSVLAQITRVTRLAGPSSRITIPISAIKVEADAVSVFTVDPDMTLQAHRVTLGTLLGDRVVIASGLTNDMSIVVDARGLRAGQTVEVR